MDAPQDIAMLLVFRLDGEAFAVRVDSVHEVLDPADPTPVPGADPFAPGLVNVRGLVVPVLDIRRRLHMAPDLGSPTARMIVLEHAIDGVATKLAFTADAVEEVITADLATLDPVPPLGAAWPQACLRGALRHGDDLVVLLDQDTVFDPAHRAA